MGADMKRILFWAVVIAGLQVFLPGVAWATPEYAAQTGRPCIDCHIDSAGGGPLTETGSRFLARVKTGGFTGHHLIRFIAGYVHLMTAIIWFGTILYVHILLKPAYAAKGLPRGELALGWISIVLISISGIVLTVYRVQSWKTFYTTRFGVLLGIKIVLFLIMLMSALIVTLFIGPRLRKRRHADRTGGGDLSPDALSSCDGNEGRPAYIAFKGAVYDVSGSRLWKDGSHLNKHRAGNDLTGFLGSAPHGEEKIFSMPRVGVLKTAVQKTERPFHERLFYFFAYMNLAFTFLIVFVIALWRWW
jgi:predicted heme/steroid binding protein/uncharacterized membrane protein